MAKRGLFGRLAESVKKTVSRLFGRNETPEVPVTPGPPEPSYVPEAPKAPEPPSMPATPEPPISTITAPEPLVDYSTDYTETDYQSGSSAAYRQFEEFKSQYDELISDANRRWEAIEVSGYSSMAIDRARDEAGRDYFSLDFAIDEQDVLEEVTRARVFLADRTSTLEGAELYTTEINAEKFRGKFGGQWRKPEYGNKGFDPEVIDEEYAKEVFRSYRKLEEEKQGLIQEYGSENLIIAMYDAITRGNDPFMTGHHIIDSWYKAKTKEWERRFEEAENEFNYSKSYEHGTPFDYVGGDLDDIELDDMYF